MPHVVDAGAGADGPGYAVGTGGSAYQGLYRLAGAAALIAAALTLGEVIILALYPQPATIGGWFELLQSRPIIGLLDLWGLEVPLYLMFALVFLALYAALGKTDPGLMLVALVLALLGVAVFVATNNPFSMLSLSGQHAVATTDAERSALLAAGQALLANTGQRGVGGFNIALLLVSIAGLVVSSVMLRSGSFSKTTAYLGLLAHGLSLADYVRQALTPSVLAALLVIIPNAVLLVAWYVAVGRRLYRLGRHEGRA